MSLNSKTPRWQRVVIWVIALTMIVGTLAGSIFMILATQNKDIDPNQIANNKAASEYKKQMEEYRKRQAETRQKMRPFADNYSDKITAFDADSVKDISVETIRDGSGATISESSTVRVNYTGWTPDGKIFDSTRQEGTDASPTELSLGQVVDGWREGLVGKKAGGIYLMTLPAQKAYGDRGSSDGAIKPNTPIRFIVEVVEVI